MKIIIRNRRNYEDKQELTISEFKIKFSKELSSALFPHINRSLINMLIIQILEKQIFM